MPNSNCLEGIRCPNSDCKSEGPFELESTCLATVGDDGVESAVDYGWTDDSACECALCHHKGTLKDFRIPDKK